MYFQVVRDSQKQWWDEHPDYQKQHRQQNPKLVESNRQQQRLRDRKRRVELLVRNNLALDLKHSASEVWLLGPKVGNLDSLKHLSFREGPDFAVTWPSPGGPRAVLIGTSLWLVDAASFIPLQRSHADRGTNQLDSSPALEPNTGRCARLPAISIWHAEASPSIWSHQHAARLAGNVPAGWIRSKPPLPNCWSKMPRRVP